MKTALAIDTDAARDARLEAFFAGYVACALWTCSDEHGAPLDEICSENDIATETAAVMMADCVGFMGDREDDLADLDMEQAGHDFWLTRNGHGAGFWDRGLGERGERLSKAAKVYGSYDLYVGDDGQVYGS